MRESLYQDGLKPPYKRSTGYMTRSIWIEKEWIHIRLRNGSFPTQSGKTIAIKAVGRVTAYMYSSRYLLPVRAWINTANTDTEQRCKGKKLQSHCPVRDIAASFTASSKIIRDAIISRILLLISADEALYLLPSTSIRTRSKPSHSM